MLISDGLFFLFEFYRNMKKEADVLGEDACGSGCAFLQTGNYVNCSVYLFVINKCVFGF